MNKNKCIMFCVAIFAMTAIASVNKKCNKNEVTSCKYCNKFMKKENVGEYHCWKWDWSPEWGSFKRYYNGCTLADEPKDGDCGCEDNQ